MGMKDGLDYPAIDLTGIVDNNEASLDIYEAVEGIYLWIDVVNMSVFEPAIGGGGVLELKTTEGISIFKWNVDGVKDVPSLKFSHGYEIGPNIGVQMVLSGANTKQAGCSMLISGRKSFQAAKKL